jgi:hypothetical protein
MHQHIVIDSFDSEDSQDSQLNLHSKNLLNILGDHLHIVGMGKFGVDLLEYQRIDAMIPNQCPHDLNFL